jgi:hypothetical protein
LVRFSYDIYIYYEKKMPKILKRQTPITENDYKLNLITQRCRTIIKYVKHWAQLPLTWTLIEVDKLLFHDLFRSLTKTKEAYVLFLPLQYLICAHFPQPHISPYFYYTFQSMFTYSTSVITCNECYICIILLKNSFFCFYLFS